MIRNEWTLIDTEPYMLKHPYKKQWACPNAGHKAVKIDDLKPGDKVVIDCYGKIWDFHSEKDAQNWNFDRPIAWSFRIIE
jgi:hypothetical protein